jgi:hypothetical protein
MVMVGIAKAKSRYNSQNAVQSTVLWSNPECLWLTLPERGYLQSWVVSSDFDIVTREAGFQVLNGEKGIVEIKGGNLIRHF